MSLVWLVAPGRAKVSRMGRRGDAVLGLLGAFRNVAGEVAMVVEVDNYLLPAFMIVLGLALVRWRAQESTTT